MTTPWKEIIEFWFEGDLDLNYQEKWFPPSSNKKQEQMDHLITEQFGKYLLSAEECDIEGIEFDKWKESPESYIALIVLLDQFSRHIHRNDSVLIHENDIRAIRCTDDILEKQWHIHLSTPQIIFLLMPYRHQPTSERLEKVVSIIDERLKIESKYCSLLEKFKNTTGTRLEEIIENDKKSWKEGDNILEFEEFESDFNGIEKIPLYKSIKQFLIDHNASNYSHLAVSLSGGVDSMVLIRLIWHMRNYFGNYNVIGIHIDYGNRPESLAESNFVEEWCNRIGIKFYKRRIDEVTRGKTKRDVYEKVAREIRYKTYEIVLNEFNGNCPAVMFGHHLGDVQENIISNMMKGCSLLDLSGMSDTSIVNGVNIWRPMLNHPKSDIFSVSHKYGIPYFLDTTPNWSTRGKMRNKLMPLLEEMYGIGYLDHLSHLGSESSQLSSITSKHLFNPFWNSIKKSNCCLWFDCKNYMDQPLFFWKEVLTHVCHQFLGVGLIREKAIKEILLRRFKQFEYSNPESCFLALRQQNKTYMKDTVLVIFTSDMFPKNSYFLL